MARCVRARTRARRSGAKGKRVRSRSERGTIDRGELRARLRERFGQVETYLSQALGVETKYVPVKSYAAAVTAFRNNQVQLAWFGGLSGVRARQLVASSINLEQTLLKMIDPGVLPDGFAEAAEASPHMDWSYFSVHLAMTRPPEYRAAEFDPDIDQAWVVNVGYDSPEAINKHWEAIRSGKLPSACPNAAINSLFDPTDAPEGHYTGLLRHYAPYSLNPGGPEAWDAMAKDFGVRCIERWQEAAPNLKNGIWLYGGSAEQIAHSLRAGRNGQMPSFKDTLSEDKIHIITAYVYGLSQ